MSKAGKNSITRKKFIGIKILANNPKLLIGITLDIPVAKKAALVVLLVANIAFEALLKVTAILFYKSSLIPSIY